MSRPIEVAIAYDEGIDEGERRQRLGVVEAEARAARLEAEVDRLRRLLGSTQRRLSERERLVYAILWVPEAFGLKRDLP